MSHTNIRTINSVEINNSGPFRVGDQLTSGTTGQVLKSFGDSLSPEWSNDTDTTYQGSSTINIDTTTDPDTINVLKVPNALTFTGSSTGTFDGSSALSINLTDSDTTYQGSSTINIDTTTDPDTINVLKVPNALTFTGSSTGTFDGSTSLSINLTDKDTTYQGSSTINIDTTTTPDTINVLKVPNVMTASTNIIFTNTDDGALETSYDGSQPITISATDTNTQYTAGTNLNLSITTFNLDASITGQTGITFLNNGASTNLTGSNYPGKPTTATNLDLSSATNIMPASSGAVLATKVQRTASFRSFGNSYAEYSSNFRTSFVATSTNVMVEFRGIIRADNKVFYGGLYDYNAGSYQADTRNRFNYNDETDQDMTTMTWWMRNLTKGTTYYISPYFRGSSATVYIYAGHTGSTDGFASAIMRIYDGGNNVDIY
tara:strand:- start:266 stop:1558 length:1293 start_codon:yes stop_codon:yes gene_type:complete